MSQQQKPVFIIDRFIDGGDEKKSIYVGIIKGGKQGIRIGEAGEPIHSLVKLTKGQYWLRYEFENNITLSLDRNFDERTLYTLRTPEYTQQAAYPGFYKKISMDSSELDEIERLQ